jgi:hypothetical protein
VVRGQSAKGVLKMNWDFALYKPEEKPQTGGGTTARSLRKALTHEFAFKNLAGTDPRPLLVLRECEVCNGTDDALLSKSADNEKIFLLASYFHCIKLPIDVLQKDHPFYELFDHEDPEHFFVSMPDGSMKLMLENQTSRTELWDAMGKVLSASYQEDPQLAVKRVQQSLDRMDVLDIKALELRAKRNEILETEGEGSKKLAKVDLEIAEVVQELEQLKAGIAKASKLTLKVAAGQPAPAGKAQPGG